jgi:peptide/nickel transport system substrate-binding protein
MDYGIGGWGRLWGVWRDNISEYTVNNDDGTTSTFGIKGQEPPQGVKDFFDLLALQNVSSVEDANRLYKDILKNIGDNVWFIIPFEDMKQPLVVNNKLRNITDKTYAIGVNFAGPQLWFDN